MSYQDSDKTVNRNGIRCAPLVLSLPLLLAGLALVYFGLALPFAWQTAVISQLISEEQRQLDAENQPVETPPTDAEDEEKEPDPIAQIGELLGPVNWYFGGPRERQFLVSFLTKTEYALHISGYADVCLLAGALFILIGLACVASCVAPPLRNRWTLLLVQTNYVLVYFVMTFLIMAAWNIFAAVEAAGMFGKQGSFVQRFYWWYGVAWPAALAALAVAWFHLFSLKASIVHLFTGRDIEEATGDRAFENMRTGGDDPQYRRSWATSGLVHIFVIVILPWLISLYGCVEDYRVPKGSGQPVVAMVKVVKQKKVKKKTYILNPNSAISFHVPNLEDDSDVQEQIKEMIEHEYEASNAMAGKMGAGGGTQGGWPDGMEDAEVRFIRLSYGGSDWDDGMGIQRGRADMNFLDEFHRQTGFKIRHHSESHPIRYLAKYRKGYAPPFVYMTGNSGISAGQRDIKILREYLRGGGMLFADAGYPAFHGSFVAFISNVFPSKRLNVIADDDPLFQMPYRFPNGPPPLWHHGGSRCLGIKHDGRWCVFYHPGDINDAWKTGHSGIGHKAARGAHQMGINVIYYSFTHYLQLTKKFRR